MLTPTINNTRRTVDSNVETITKGNISRIIFWCTNIYTKVFIDFTTNPALYVNNAFTFRMSIKAVNFSFSVKPIINDLTDSIAKRIRISKIITRVQVRVSTSMKESVVSESLEIILFAMSQSFIGVGSGSSSKGSV